MRLGSQSWTPCAKYSLYVPTKNIYFPIHLTRLTILFSIFEFTCPVCFCLRFTYVLYTHASHKARYWFSYTIWWFEAQRVNSNFDEKLGEWKRGKRASLWFRVVKEATFSVRALLENKLDEDKYRSNIICGFLPRQATGESSLPTKRN